MESELISNLPKKGDEVRAYLPRVFFRQLTDAEFKIIFYSHEYEFMVSEKTAAYIIDRAKSLGLKKHNDIKIVDENSS